MANFIFPNTERIAAVTAIQTPFATGKIRLIQSPLTLTPGMNEADLVAVEADYTGYAAKTLTTLPAPYIDQVNGGVSFEIPTQQFDIGATPTVFNDIYGGWVEDSGANLLMAFTVINPYPMQGVGDALPLNLILNFFGSNQVYVLFAGVPQ